MMVVVVLVRVVKVVVVFAVALNYRKQENKRLGPDGRVFYVPIGSFSPFSEAAVDAAARDTTAGWMIGSVSRRLVLIFFNIVAWRREIEIENKNEDLVRWWAPHEHQQLIGNRVIYMKMSWQAASTVYIVVVVSVIVRLLLAITCYWAILNLRFYLWIGEHTR